MFQLFHNHASAREIDNALRAALKDVNNWVGEIPLSRRDFDWLCEVLRLVGSRSLSSTMRVTAMVFTVRYAEYGDDEHPNFWEKYASMVWGLPEADQTFQNEHRIAFRLARTELEDRFGFYFPHKLDMMQDVVGGVYMHAILPSYLQDDFANLLAKLLRSDDGLRWYADESFDNIAAHLQQHPAVKSVRRRLERFISGEATNLMAARLVQTLAIATYEFFRGEESNHLAQMLAPIEREIWQMLLPELESLRDRFQRQETRGTRTRRASTSWAWDMRSGTLCVQVKNWQIKGEQPPDRIVWAEFEDQLSAYEHFLTLTPWKNDGGWEVDVVYLPVPADHGFITLVDEYDQQLSTQPIRLDRLPHDDLLFFRVDREGIYAILTDYGRISDGEYLISGKLDIELSDGTHPDRDRTYLLNTATSRGPIIADRFLLRLPVNLITEGQTLFIRNRRGVLSAELEGTLVTGTGVHGLPVFREVPQLRIINAGPILEDILRLRLRVLSNMQSSSEVSLSKVSFQHDGHDLLLELRGVISPLTALHEIQLMRNFTPSLKESLRFALIPAHIDLHLPDPNGYYSIEEPPKAIVAGINVDQVAVVHGQACQGDNTVEITWFDPQHAAQFVMTIDDVTIPIVCPITWSHAWIEPTVSTLSAEDLEEASIHLRGARGQTFHIYVGADKEPRTISLSTDGTYDNPLRRDALFDMVRDYPGARAKVWATDHRTTWKLFELIRLDNDNLSELAQYALLAARDFRRRAIPNDSADTSDLLALPSSHLSTLPPSLNDHSKVGVALSVIRGAAGALHNLPSKVQPSLSVLLLMESGSSHIQAVFEQAPHLKTETAGRLLGLSDNAHDGEVSVLARMHFGEEDPYQLIIYPDLAREISVCQCAVCHSVFVDNRSTRILHSHGKGWGIKHRVIDVSSPLVVSVRLESSKVPDWELDFSDLIDTSTVQRWRKMEDKSSLSKRSNALWLSREHYLSASAEWIRRLGGGYAEPLNALVNPKSDDVRTINRISENILSNDRWFPAIRAINTLSRTLLPDRSKVKENRWLSLEANLLTLGCLYRGAAHGINPVIELITPEVRRTSKTLLGYAIDACPQLTGWAFGWCELYFSYFDVPMAIRETDE